MANQCDTCAFKKGAAANREPYNLLRSTVCALSGVPFFCHEGFDWRNFRQGLPPREHRKVCAGWQQNVRQLAAKGRFANEDRRRTLHVLGGLALEEIELGYGSDKTERDKMPHRTKLRRILTFLMRGYVTLSPKEIRRRRYRRRFARIGGRR